MVGRGYLVTWSGQKVRGRVLTPIRGKGLSTRKETTTTTTTFVVDNVHRPRFDSRNPCKKVKSMYSYHNIGKLSTPLTTDPY